MSTERILTDAALATLNDLMGDGARLVVANTDPTPWLSLGNGDTKEVSKHTADLLIHFGLVAEKLAMFSYVEYRIDTTFACNASEEYRDPGFNLWGGREDLDYVQYVMNAIDNVSYYGAKEINLPNGMSAAAKQVMVDLGYTINGERISWP